MPEQNNPNEKCTELEAEAIAQLKRTKSVSPPTLRKSQPPVNQAPGFWVYRASSLLFVNTAKHRHTPTVFKISVSTK